MAEKGDAMSAYAAAKEYEQEGNFIHAARLYEVSAARQYKDAFTPLGHLYESGKGVPRNLERAIYWCSEGLKAEKDGWSKGAYRLGMLYFSDVE
ncbi:MAG TPA: hypothetical protein VEF76_13005 [Patescibacteria group bacterium]|nr:hypothetical protein [Patescibacteria group bacterium]